MKKRIVKRGENLENKEKHSKIGGRRSIRVKDLAQKKHAQKEVERQLESARARRNNLLTGRKGIKGGEAREKGHTTIIS